MQSECQKELTQKRLVVRHTGEGGNFSENTMVSKLEKSSERPNLLVLGLNYFPCITRRQDTQ